MNLSHPWRALAAAAIISGGAVGTLAVAGAAGAAPPARGTGGLPGQGDPGSGYPGNPPGTPHALFVQTEGLSGNEILSYNRAPNGTLSPAGTFPTGGLGGHAVTAVADPLGSQGSLRLVDNDSFLIASNAGSNTVSLFAVRGARLTLLQIIASGGEFPVSIASDGPFVAVLNSGGTGSVAEFFLAGDRLVPVPNGVRSLGLDNTDPPNFLLGAGQVGFTPGGAHLIVTTKGSTSAYEVFNVFGGFLSESPVVTPGATPSPFSFTFDSAGRLVAAEAGTSSVTTYRVNPTGRLSEIGTVSDGQTALCWITGITGTFYGSNAGSGNVSSFTEERNGAPRLDAATAAAVGAGTTESVASPDGRFLYVEAGGAGVLDTFSVGHSGSITNVQTTAIPVASEGLAAS